MALSIVVLLWPVERDADQIELGDDVDLVPEIPAVGVHRDVDAARLQVVDQLADVLAHQRLAAHDADAHHPRVRQHVDGAVPVGGAHLIAVHLRQMTIYTPEVALVRDGHGHHEGKLPAREAGERKTGQPRRLTRHRNHVLGRRSHLLERYVHTPLRVWRGHHIEGGAPESTGNSEWGAVPG